MWKKIILAALVLILAVPAVGLSYLYLRKPAQAAALDIKVPMTPERIARGKILFTTIADCDGCHSQRDFTRVGGPVAESGRGQGNLLSAVVPGLSSPRTSRPIRTPGSARGPTVKRSARSAKASTATAALCSP